MIEVGVEVRYAARERAAMALFTAWHELLLTVGSLPLTAWPQTLAAVEDELTQEIVLLALPPFQRSLVEQYADVPRCRCGARLMTQDERVRSMCVDCAADLMLDAEDDEWERASWS